MHAICPLTVVHPPSRSYYENKDYGNFVSVVPTSAHTGEGIPDLLLLLVHLTQRRMKSRLAYSPKLQARARLPAFAELPPSP